MKKRDIICIISHYCFPDGASDSVRLLKVIKSLKDKDFDIIIVTAFPHYPDGVIPAIYKKRCLIREYFNGVDIIRTYVPALPHKGLFRRFLIYISFSFSALLALFYLKKRKENVKVIWAFSQKFFSYFTGLIYKIILNAPLLLDVVDIWPEAIINTGIFKSRNNFFLKVVRFCLKIFYILSDGLITLNEAMKQLIIKSIHLEPSKIYLLPNITYPEKLKPIKIRENQYKNEFIVMYSGNLGAMYDFKNLLKSAFILKKNKSVKFIIKGIGDISIKSSLQRYIAEQKLSNVHLEEKFLDTEEFIKFLSMADVFILPMKDFPYPDASFPSKLMDYLTFGKPVIYTGKGYTSTLIKEYEMGISINPNEPKELANTILYLRENDDVREKMGENARKAVKELYSPQIMEKRLKKIFSNFL